MTGGTIEEEIVEWSTGRPAWQRAVMRRVARGEVLTDADYTAIADLLVQPAPATFGQPLAAADVPRAQPSAVGSVALVGIRDLSHVNALMPGQTLDFAPTGLTVVYGDNGSGKSGYARLLKAVARARARDRVRSDIFDDDANQAPAGKIVVRTGTNPPVEISWPDGNVDDLAAIGFYDEACGDMYLTSDTEMSYRPSALGILDGLIGACDGVRAVLDRRLAENSRRALRLPELRPDTPAGRFAAALSAKSDANVLHGICGSAANAAVEVAALREEEARLRSIDPARERSRLLGVATKLDRLSAHLARVAAGLGSAPESSMSAAHDALRTAEAAATAATAATFEREPLPGVGSRSWKVLWDAARAYAIEGAKSHAFPDTHDGARCVLCQQTLDASAADRLRRFDAFVRDTVQAQLVAARRAWDQARQHVEAIDCAPADLPALLDDIDESHGQLVQQARAFLDLARRRKAALLAAGEAAAWTAVAPLPSAVPTASAAADELRAQATAIETRDHEQTLRDIAVKRIALEDASRLAPLRDSVLAEIARLAERDRLEAAKGQTATTGISTKAAELMRAHVTAVVRDRFTRETHELRLERVTLNDLGVRKGALRHQAGFVGARQAAPLPEVLSEGEQTALGLAGFFTEAYLDASRAALVLDDPVSSLDHRRRAKVAERIAAFAKDRQVIVFTHDIAFVGDLARCAEAAQITIAERSVERSGAGKPGMCQQHHPWKARDVPQRLHDLGAELAKLKNDQPNLDQAAYETRAADWAGKLSETWERILVLEVVGQVFDLGTQQVHPKKFRLLTKITEADDNEFQASYGRVSQWARRHDKSLAVNYVPPTIDEMRKELDLVKGWFDRVKKYKS